MRTTRVLAIALALLPVLATAQSRAATAFIAAKHREMERAALKNDYEAVEKLILGTFLPTFTITGTDKKRLTRGDMLAGIKKDMMSGGRPQLFQFTLGRATKRAGKVLVPARLRIKVRIPQGEDGKPHTIESDQTFTETWVQVGSTWKMASIVSRTMSTKMDGKPMPPPPGG